MKSFNIKDQLKSYLVHLVFTNSGNICLDRSVNAVQNKVIYLPVWWSRIAKPL